MERETVQTDVLIIGGGGAGSRAAYEAKRLYPQLNVTVAVEGKWGKTGSTVWVASEALGINAPINAAGDGDSPEIFLKDIIDTGLGTANEAMVKIIADESSDRIYELVDLGASFDMRNGKYVQKKLSGCTKARSLTRGGQTGVEIVQALKNASLKKGVDVIEGTRILDLIVRDGEVWGARGIKKGRQIDIAARAVIMACGGAGALFPHSVTHKSLRGDGYAMACRAGAVMSGMEFIQIGPGVVFPSMHFIIHAHMWRFLPRLKNRLGEEFLKDYVPGGISIDEVISLKSMSFPFSVRTDAKYIDIAMSQEIMAGRGTDHGGIFFDISHISGEELQEKAPITYQTFMDKGIDLSQQAIEIAPLVQSLNGGIKINEHASSSVLGLFAVGEASGGVHGADRPGGNNLADSQVFGYRGGQAAAKLAIERSGSMPGVESESAIGIGAGADSALEDIYPAIDAALMVVRNRRNLDALLEKITSYRKSHKRPDIANDNVLLVAEMIAKSALLREESRGIHYREDFPETNPLYNRATMVKRDDSGDLKAIFE
ncbi:MAG: FAD-dependent oxidoreductase [Deltaproteobacteria bacterium]|nr:FAD-dependent oxidoreductase [Deltaproteobacteria bacterium]